MSTVSRTAVAELFGRWNRQELGDYLFADAMVQLLGLDDPDQAQLPLPPTRGDQVRVLFRLPEEEGGGTIAMSCIIVEWTRPGLWWIPVEDNPTPEFTPWSHIDGLTAERR